MSFSQRQKILKCLWSESFELQKCGHTEKSNYGLNLSIILMLLTIYGVGKSQCDRSTSHRNLLGLVDLLSSLGHVINYLLTNFSFRTVRC